MVVARQRIGDVFVVLVMVARQRLGGVFFCCVSGWVEVARQRIGGVFVVLVVVFVLLVIFRLGVCFFGCVRVGWRLLDREWVLFLLCYVITCDCCASVKNSLIFQINSLNQYCVFLYK